MVRWKDIKGYEGHYQISDSGLVRSLKSDKLLTLSRLTKCGYRKASLSKGGKAREFRIHRLVAETFVPNPHKKETVNHIDGDKLNNDASNLEWSTRSEQVYHSYELGLKKPIRGASNKNAKLTDNQVREIRKAYVRQSREFGTVALAAKYGVTSRVIGLVVNGKSYRHIK